MSLRLTTNFTLMFAVGVSLFGCFTTAAVALSQPRRMEGLALRKPLIGSIFALICMSGMLATFYPKKCSERFYAKETLRPIDSGLKNPGSHKQCVVLVGHHPSCGAFSAHLAYIGGRAMCAACLGLFLGGIAALAGTILYFFGSLELGQFGLWAVLAGQATVLLGFVQFKFRGYPRMLANAFFVFAAYLTLAGIDGVLGSFYVDIYVVVLIAFWLWTRIMLSQWDHWRICHGCQRSCGA